MQKISVYPNPFVALGPDGMPCGRVYVEPGHPRPYDVVGGKLVKKTLERPEDASRTARERATAKKLDTRGALVRGEAHVRMRPVVVLKSQFFQERINAGDLFAADKDSAKACGIVAKDFVEPFALLSAALKKTIAEWEAVNGEPPAVADYQLVQNGDEIALAAKDAAEPVREAPPNVQPKPKANP